MSEPTRFQRFRMWLGYDVLLKVLYFVVGERPLFCDLATDGCPLDNVDYEAVTPDE